MSPGLVALGVPLPLEVVRDQVQRGAWWVGHEPSLAVDVLRGLPRLSSIEALLAAWPAPITASVRDPAGRGDEERSVGVSATDAPMLLASGMKISAEPKPENPRAVPDIIRAGQPWRTPFPPGQEVERFPRAGWDRPKASDHCPVAITLHIAAA